MITNTCPPGGYACPPSHSVPSETVIVRTEQPDLAVTGGQVDPGLIVAAILLTVIGAVTARAFRLTVKS